MTNAPVRSFWHPTAAAAGSLTVVALPSFLVGAFAPRIKDDLDFGDTQLGALFTLGYLVSALVLLFGGSFSDVRGPRQAMRLGMVMAGVGTLALGLATQTYVVLVLAFMVNRAAEAVTQPATNTLVSSAVEIPRRGIAMGIKQAAIPFATAVAGLAVPVLSGTIGWRGAFVIVALLAVPAWLAVPDVGPTSRDRARSNRELWQSPHLRVLAVAGAFAAASVVTVAGFLTTAAEEAGYRPETAGLLLSLGGVIMIASRLTWGLVADRRQFNRFVGVAGSLAVGSLAFLAFAQGTQTSIAIGTVLIFGIGWSWPGLLLLGVLEQHPHEPGAATAVMQTGIRLGALASPIAFGALADGPGFAWAWRFSFVLALSSAALMALASRSVGPTDHA